MYSSNPSNNVTDDKILLSYQDYMLAGTAATKSDTKNDTSRDYKRASDNDHDHKNRKEMGRNASHNAAAVTKRFRALLTTFALTVANDWLYNDDQLSTVISSIDNLRQRLPVIYRQWVQRKNQRQGRLQGVPLWKPYNSTSKVSRTSTGPYSSLTVELTEEDLFLTLHHELQNHEKYMTYVRKLLLQMSDAVQTSSRQLDAAFLFYQQHTETLATSYDASYDYNASFLLDLACDVFTILSKELHRRQTLAQTDLLNTGMDQLLPEEDINDVTSRSSFSDGPSTSSYFTSSLVSKNDGIGINETMRLNLFIEMTLHQTNNKKK